MIAVHGPWNDEEAPGRGYFDIKEKDNEASNLYNQYKKEGVKFGNYEWLTHHLE